MRILVINPGSTSTKVSVFDDGAEVFTRSVFHDAPQLLEYPTTNDQLPFRKGVVFFRSMESISPQSMSSSDAEDVHTARAKVSWSSTSGS